MSELPTTGQVLHYKLDSLSDPLTATVTGTHGVHPNSQVFVDLAIDWPPGVAHPGGARQDWVPFIAQGQAAPSHPYCERPA